MNSNPKSKGIIALTGPLIISFWLRSAFGWVDPFFAANLTDELGNLIGDPSMAAIGLTLPFEFMMIACWVGTSNGLTSRLAKAIAAGENAQLEQLKKAARQITWALNGLFLCLAGSIWWLSPKLGLDPAVATQFQIYATVVVAGTAFTSFWSILPDSLVKAHQDTKTTMWAGILSSSLNVLLNTIFTFVLGMGIFGIAFSTVLGRLAGLAYAGMRARQHEVARLATQVSDENPNIKLEKPIWGILSIAIPSGLGYVLLAIESQLVNWMLVRMPDSTSQLAAWSIFDRTTRFLAMPLIAASVAMLPLVARRSGAKDIAGIKIEISTSMRFAIAYVVFFVWPAAVFFAPTIAHWLTAEAATESAAVSAMRLIPIFVFAMIPVMILRAVFDGFQRPRPALFIALVRTFGLVGPLVWIGIKVATERGMEPTLGAAIGLTVGVAGASLCTVLCVRQLKILK